MNEREQLMRKLQSLQFALVELGLYLDTHPQEAQAMKMFASLQSERNDLAEEYEKNYGPLTAGGGSGADYWNWVASPFPWEV